MQHPKPQSHPALSFSSQGETQGSISIEVYSEILSGLGDVVVIIDQEGTNRYKSKNFEALYGWSAEEVIGRKSWKKVHADEQESAQAFFKSLIGAPNSVASFECRYLCKDGTYKWIRFTGRNLMHDANINGILGSYHDITERKESELKYKKLFESSSFGSILIDPTDATIVDYNKQVCQQLNYTTEEFSTLTLFDIIANETPDEVLERLKTVLERGATDFHSQHIKKDGTLLDVYVSLQSITISNKKLLQALIFDITRQKENEKKLMETQQKAYASELRFKSLFQNIHNNFSLFEVIWGDDGHPCNYRFLEVNSQFEEITGFEASFLKGKTLMDVFPQTSQAWLEVLRSTVEESRPHTVVNHDNEIDKYYEVTSFIPQKGQLAIIGTDITERQRAEMELISAKNKAEKNDAVNVARLHLLSYAETHSMDELLEETLNQVEKLTESKIGFYHTINPDQKTLTLQNWSTQTKAMFCNAKGKGDHYPIADAGVWVDCVHSKQPVIHNDYQSLPHKKGLPEGHANVIRELVVPVYKGSHLKAILGVGNKEGLYDQEDVETTLLLANLVWEIVERKLVENNLKKLQRAVESAKSAIVITDKEGKIEYANPFFTVQTGYTQAEYLGLTPNVLKSDYHLPDHYKNLWDTILKGNTWEGEFLNKKKNGELFWENAVISPVIDKKGEITNFVAVKTDVSANKKMIDELIRANKIVEESENKFKAAFYTSPDAINLTRMNGEYVEVNDGFTKLTDYTKEDVVGKVSTDLNIWANPEDRDKLVHALKTVGYIENLEAVFKGKKGQLVPALMSARIITIKGEPLILSITRDISQRKAYEQELILAKEKAEESDRLKTAFMQNLSHEIRTPMNAIIGFSQLLAFNLDNIEKLESFTQIINQRSIDLLAIIDDILDIAKIESGQMTLNQDTCDLDCLLEEIELLFVEQQARQEKPHIAFRVAMDASVRSLSFATDTGKLKQVLIILLNNALKFTDTGKIEIGAQIDANQRLFFYVSDTGIGIAQDQQERIFERFIQINHGTNRKYGGNGLGLPIAKGLVELLGGKIWVESQPGQGSTFRFSIQMHQCSWNDRKTDSHSLPPANANPHYKHLLIVEDDKTNLMLLEEILSESKEQLTFAENGHDGVRMAIETKPDLILMDIGLPDISGYEATNRILSQNPSMKIVAVTAYSSPADREKAMNAGCIDHLGKPIKRKDLFALLEKYLY